LRLVNESLGLLRVAAAGVLSLAGAGRQEHILLAWHGRGRVRRALVRVDGGVGGRRRRGRLRRLLLRAAVLWAWVGMLVLQLLRVVRVVDGVLVVVELLLRRRVELGLHAWDEHADVGLAWVRARVRVLA